MATTPTTGYLKVNDNRVFCVFLKGLFSYYEGETFNRSNVGKNELGNLFLKNCVVSNPTDFKILLSNLNDSAGELVLEAASESAYNAWIKIIMSNIEFAGLTEEEKNANVEMERLAKEKIILDEKTRVADVEKKRLEEKRAEEKRRAELTEEEKLAEDEVRLAEEMRVAEERKLAEETKLAEQKKRDEEWKLAKETKLAEQKKRDEEWKLAEEKRVAEEKRLITAISEIKDFLIEGNISKCISHANNIEDKDLLLDLIDSFQDASKIQYYLDRIEHKDHEELKAILSDSRQKFCKHKYLDKWEGVYICMNCKYKLTEESDSYRIIQETTLEASTPCDVVTTSIGEMSQMRGIKIKFLIDFTSKYNCWSWSSWDIIRKIIKPATESSRCRFVELPEMVANIGPASAFISYAQAGKFGDIVAAICDGAIDLERCVWIDIFAVRQWPSDNPDLDFASTIKFCQSFLIVTSYVPHFCWLEDGYDSDDTDDIAARNAKFNHDPSIIPFDIRRQIAFCRVWCLVELHAAVNEKLPIVLKCGSHSLLEGNKFEFIPNDSMLETLLEVVNIQKAEATVASDKERIFDSIKKGAGFLQLNAVARRVISGGASADLRTYYCINPSLIGFGDSHLQYLPCIDFSLTSLLQSAVCNDSEAEKQIMSSPTEFIIPCAKAGFTVLLKKLLSSHTGDIKDRLDEALLNSCSGGQDGCIEVLLQSGANANAKKDKITALMMASYAGTVEGVEFLASYGADVNAVDRNGNSVIVHCARGFNLDVILTLHSLGADINCRDRYFGRTPLEQAASVGNLKCLKYLIENGAEVNPLIENSGRCINSLTPLKYACFGGNYDCVMMLLEKGATVECGWIDQFCDEDIVGSSALLISAEIGNVDIVKALIQYGANVSLNNENGVTPLIAASRLGHFECLEVLLNSGADVNYCSTGEHYICKSALHAASEKGHLKCIKVLLDNSADIEIRDRSGMTALLISAKGGFIDCVQFLLSKGADINTKDYKDRTFINLAAENVLNYMSLTETFCKTAPGSIAAFSR